MINSTPIQETRQFKMHNNLMHTIIFKQSGSFEKAITELLMNSIDANSTRIDITYDKNENIFIIEDDGKGFSTDEEIEAFFDTLGTPHKDGDAKFGRFRIGRTQIFAYASTVWRSGTYKMSVDFLNNDSEDGLSYKLEKNLPFQKGCIITGHRYSCKQLGQNFTNSLSLTIQNVYEEYFPYSDIPIYVNNELVISPNNKREWDLVTNNAYYKFNNYRGAFIYNMGAFVKSYDGSYFGTGVDIITKKALDINFARNDIILYSCELFKEISKEIKEHINKTALKKNKLNLEQKKYIFNQFMNRELEYHEVRHIKIFSDVFEKDFSLEDFVKAKKVSFSDGKSGKLAERIHEDKVALVFNSNFAYISGEKAFNKFIKSLWDMYDFLLKEYKKEHPSYGYINSDRKLLGGQRYVGNIKDFESAYSLKHEILETSQLNKKEQILLKSIRRLNDIFYKEYYKLLNSKKRKIVFGDSIVSDAWTDGDSYIAINKKFITIFDYGIKSFDYVLKLIIHEYCHNNFTINEHPHNQEFYKLYHDITIKGGFSELKDYLIPNISNFPKRAALVFHNDLLRNKIKVPKKLKQELSNVTEFEENYNVEYFLSSFSDNYWENNNNRTFEDCIQDLFLNSESATLYRYILTKNAILHLLNNNEYFDTKDLFIKIDNINLFVDFIIANLFKVFRTKTLTGVLKNINTLIDLYNKRERDYNIDYEIKKELKEDIDYRKALKFIYENTKRNSYFRNNDNSFNFCIVEKDTYNRLKKEFEFKHPTLFKKLNIDKNLKEKLEVLKKEVEIYNNKDNKNYDELNKIRRLAQETLPIIKIIISEEDYSSFEKLGYIYFLKEANYLYYYKNERK